MEEFPSLIWQLTRICTWWNIPVCRSKEIAIDIEDCYSGQALDLSTFVTMWPTFLLNPRSHSLWHEAQFNRWKEQVSQNKQKWEKAGRWQKDKHFLFSSGNLQEFVCFCHYRPLAHHGNAANLEDKTKQMFSSGNWDLFSCKKILFVLSSRLAAFPSTCKGSIPKYPLKGSVVVPTGLECNIWGCVDPLWHRSNKYKLIIIH